MGNFIFQQTEKNKSLIIRMILCRTLLPGKHYQNTQDRQTQVYKVFNITKFHKVSPGGNVSNVSVQSS